MSEELKALLGESYKEGMTIEEVGDFFKGKKFADLSTGNYVDKNKYNSEINTLTNKLNETKSELNNKLTDEEKNNKASKEQADRIKELEQMLKNNTLAGNKDYVNGILTSSREMLGIADNDTDFADFVDNIITEDRDKVSSVANYISKIIKDSYEKGKQDATKDAMGDFGKNKGQSSNNQDDEVGKLGKDLASKIKPKETYDYFK